jgi:allophanate hydrolase
VWALPTEGFARFVAGIPAPLGIGTLLLADGTRPKGFLCEAAGTRGAKAISSFGGWRAYVAAARTLSAS